MKKEVFVNEETIKIIEYKKKFFSRKVVPNEINIPVHLIKLVQKAYAPDEGTASVSIFLETENEFLICYDEVDNIDKIFAELLNLKEQTNKFRVEIYNIETHETIDK